MLKEKIYQYINAEKAKYLQLGDTLFSCPELGYKEFKTKKHIVEFLKQEGVEVEAEYFETGFQISIGKGKPHIALIAELDAIPVVNHPFASPVDQACHACGHSTQVVNMLLAFLSLRKSGLFSGEKETGTLTLFFTPAEEYIDLAYRETLIQEGKIKHIGGKINMIEAGLFDEVDVVLHLHAMGNPYAYGYGSSLAGFKYKKFIFQGKAAHAGAAPFEGINALNAFTLFNAGLGMLRETFESPQLRVHGILTKGGESVNSVPAEVVYECYIRSMDFDVLQQTDKKLDTLATHCAKALGAEVQIQNRKGYLPLKPNRLLSEVVHQVLLNFVDEKDIIANEESIAGGDIGDVSYLLPTIQFGYNGFSGRIHGADFEIKDKCKAYIEPAQIVVETVLKLVENHQLVEEIKASHQGLSQTEYLEYLNKD